MNVNDIAVIILAAGHSTRFGSSKMMHRLPNGKTVLMTTIEQYRLVFENISVVLKQCDELVSSLAHSDVKRVLNPHAHLGMSQSIIEGLHAQNDAKAYLIALGDMPYVSVDTLGLCAERTSTESIVIPVCDGREGHPVIFGADFRDPMLVSLQGDVGGKPVIGQNIDLVTHVEVDDQGVLHDIDRPEDVLSVNSRLYTE